jgi:hypothetical protein
MKDITEDIEGVKIFADYTCFDCVRPGKTDAILNKVLDKNQTGLLGGKLHLMLECLIILYSQINALIILPLTIKE